MQINVNLEKVFNLDSNQLKEGQNLSEHQQKFWDSCQNCSYTIIVMKTNFDKIIGEFIPSNVVETKNKNKLINSQKWFFFYFSG